MFLSCFISGNMKMTTGTIFGRCEEYRHKSGEHTLQHTATHCNTLQHTATYLMGGSLHEQICALSSAGVLQCVAMCCSVLRCCSVLQCVAVCLCVGCRYQICRHIHICGHTRRQILKDIGVES